MIDKFLADERVMYAAIKPETEESYYQAFQKFPMPPVESGKPAKGNNVAFIVHSANLLAHVQMMRGVLREKDRVFVINGDGEGFGGLLPCPVISLPQVDLSKRFEILRQRLAEYQCGTMIWVSAPLWARYAFALRLSEKQVYWAMRFHPIAPGDLNITAGKRGEKTRTFNGIEWKCVHAPFNVEAKQINKLHAEQYRVPYQYVYGTMARDKKYSPEYLQCVAEILNRHPESGFVWTGKTEPLHIRQFFRERGLSNRHRFVGWQDPDMFVNTIDCFLETFPLGGLTTFTAMAHGVPVVSLMNPHSPLGSLESVPDGLLRARSSDDYVGMAIDRGAKATAIKAGFSLIESERRQAKRDQVDFWRVVNG